MSTPNPDASDLPGCPPTTSGFSTAEGSDTDKAEPPYTVYKDITCLDYDRFIEEFLPEAAAQGLESTDMSPLKPAASPKLQALSRHSSSKRVMRSNSAVTSTSSSGNPFAGMAHSTSEQRMYSNITAALNAAAICDGYTFVTTSTHKNHSSGGAGGAVDCGMYRDNARDGANNRVGSGHTDWSSIEIAIVCNSTAGDPLDQRINDDDPHAADRRKLLRQMLSGMELVFNHQQRTLLYMILFIGQFARVVRVDRSGIFATHKFSYRKDGSKLAHFLRCYSRLSPEARGHDTTAVRLNPRSNEAIRMRSRVEDVEEDDYVAWSFKKLLDEDWPWWKLEVPDETDPQKPRYYLVAKPHFQAPGVAGRATRGYIALPADEKDDTFVYLKDAWRVVSDHIDKEGVILETLREHKVEFVPTLICHGDLAGQGTKAQAVWKKLYPDETCYLKEHKHYRLAVEEVGKSLEEFASGSEFVTALLCCVVAHQQAYEKGIIHRDISAGNILLYQRPDGQWHGLLNDWELSKQRVHQEGEGRQPDRTGTWQFLSANALNDHAKTIVVQDELESFFHVLLYIAIRFLPHNCYSASVPQLLKDYFDDYSPHVDGHRCGARKLSTMREGYVDLSIYNKKEKNEPDAVLHFHWPCKSGNAEPQPPHPLDELVDTLLSWFRAYYKLSLRPSAVQPVPLENEDKQNSVVPAARGILAEMAMKMQAGREGGHNAGNASSSSAPTPTATTLVPPADQTSAQKASLLRKQRSREKLECLAKNLETHDPMVRLLMDALAKEWPAHDRCDDRKPEKGWAPAFDPVAKGSKRSSDVLAERLGKPAKRSRVR
ncbi:hypothetical protein OH77DRAFT_1046834 [Trametes cingulata]|nr:hypothetical protein OH77DRAFT_1046834 [Trametes cingulata]